MGTTTPSSATAVADMPLVAVARSTTTAHVTTQSQDTTQNGGTIVERFHRIVKSEPEDHVPLSLSLPVAPVAATTVPVSHTQSWSNTTVTSSDSITTKRRDGTILDRIVKLEHALLEDGSQTLGTTPVARLALLEENLGISYENPPPFIKRLETLEDCVGL